jgi:hypothetical protein
MGDIEGDMKAVGAGVGFFIGAILGAVIGFHYGGVAGAYYERCQAVKAGVGSWSADPKTGGTEFVYGRK